jgi:hypothetical protein
VPSNACFDSQQHHRHTSRNLKECRSVRGTSCKQHMNASSPCRRWYTPLHARVPYMQKHLFPSKAGSYCRTACGETPIAVEGQARRPRTSAASCTAKWRIICAHTRISVSFLPIPPCASIFRFAAHRGIFNHCWRAVDAQRGEAGRPVDRGMAAGLSGW